MFLLNIILVLMLSVETRNVVYAEQEWYARILYEQVYLYRQPIDDNSLTNVYFELPKTYFVRLIDRAGDDFYLAEYNGVSGYVKKDSVRAVSSTPSNPYLSNVTFRIYAEPSRDMRSFPSNDTTLSEQITYIPLYNNNIQYISSIKGQELVLNRTNVWYFCKYTADKDYYGYVYSDFCDEMTQKFDNTETVTYVENPTFIPEKTNEEKEINSSLYGIILTIMIVPAIAFILLIMRGKHILNYHNSKHEVTDY